MEVAPQLVLELRRREVVVERDALDLAAAAGVVEHGVLRDLRHRALQVGVREARVERRRRPRVPRGEARGRVPAVRAAKGGPRPPRASARGGPLEPNVRGAAPSTAFHNIFLS